MAGNGLTRLGGCVWLDRYAWLGVSAAAAATAVVAVEDGDGKRRKTIRLSVLFLCLAPRFVFFDDGFRRSVFVEERTVVERANLRAQYFCRLRGRGCSFPFSFCLFQFVVV